MRLGKRRQYLGFMIERGITGYFVFDWDYEFDGQTLAVFKTLRDAERFIEARSV